MNYAIALATVPSQIVVDCQNLSRDDTQLYLPYPLSQARRTRRSCIAGRSGEVRNSGGLPCRPSGFVTINAAFGYRGRATSSTIDSIAVSRCSASSILCVHRECRTANAIMTAARAVNRTRLRSENRENFIGIEFCCAGDVSRRTGSRNHKEFRLPESC